MPIPFFEEDSTGVSEHCFLKLEQAPGIGRDAEKDGWHEVALDHLNKCLRA